MKKLIFMSMAMLAITSVWAQRTGNTHFGLKAGVNLANLKIENATEADPRVGFHVGGLAHIHISRQFAVQPELTFSTQGRKQTINGVKYENNLNYINLPVLAQFMTGSGFRLQTGPQLGILLTDESQVNNVEVDVDDQHKTVDLSWSFGASYLTKTGFGFDARYNHGISNINDVSNADIRNRVWQFGVFYQFMHK